MEQLCKPELCTGCGACAAVCPVGCIRMSPDEEGFLRPVVDIQNCVGCNRCQKVCPITEASNPATATIAYAAINEDERTRFASTSGGVFTLLSRWVLERGGIVFGAAYDYDFNVVHCAVENPDDLSRLRGAKYAQSDLGSAYRQVQSNLKEGRYVLFSGTPCQVGGLISFLGKQYENLILVDLICHGVPSPKVWQHYISYRGKQDADGQRPLRINLRSKESGWPAYSVRFDYSGGQFYTAPNSRDPYLWGFVKNLYLRPSCYHCQFKGSTRLSDFTLGDYWGVWAQEPEYHDEKGTSLVLLHTDKARKLWEQITENMRFTEVHASSALVDNPSALTSPEKPSEREQFFGRFETENFQTLICELCPKPAAPARPSILRRAVNKLRRIIR